MIELTVGELLSLKDAMELAVEELNGVEECTDPSDYVLTTGAKEELEAAINLITIYLNKVEQDDDTLSNPGHPDQ